MYQTRSSYIRPSDYHSPLRPSSPVRAHEFVANLSPSRRYTYIAPSIREYPRYVPAPAYHSPVKNLYSRHHHSPVRASAHVPVHYHSPVRVLAYNPLPIRTSYSRPMYSGYVPTTPVREPEKKVEEEALESLEEVS